MALLLDLAGPRLGAFRGRRLAVPLGALFVLLFGVVQSNLVGGQVNLPVLFLSVLFVRLYVRGRPRVACLALAVAIAVKLVPAILLVFLAARRRWGLAALALGLALALCLLPVPLLGSRVLGVYRYYLGQMAGARVPMTANGIFTPAGVAYYLLPPVRAVPGLWLTVASAAVVLLPLLALERLRIRAGVQGVEVWFLALYLLANLMTSPLSWTHHLAHALPAALLVGLWLLPPGRPRDGGVTRAYAASLALLVAGPWVASLTTAVLVGPNKHGPFTFLGLALMGVAVAGVVRQELAGGAAAADLPDEPEPEAP